MTPERLAWIRDWFLAHVRSFQPLHPMMKLKRSHTMRVARLCRDIAVDLGWPDGDVRLAEAIGILHDVARFEQFRDYGTYSDAMSFDHGERGYEILVALPLDDPPGDRLVILEAVRFHNRFRIPDDATPAAVPFVQVIRDADKLDVLAVVREYAEAGRIGELYAEVSPSGPVDRALLDELIHDRPVSSHLVHCTTDLYLVQLSWVHDMNLAPALRRLHDSGLLDWFIAQLPDDPGIRAFTARIRAIVDKAGLP